MAVRNWIALGKKRAFTFIGSSLPDHDELVYLARRNGMIETDHKGEFVAKALNSPQLIRLLRHIDYSDSFIDLNPDEALAGRLNRKLHPQSPNPADNADFLDSSYINTDLDANFQVWLKGQLEISGLPARYYWAAYKGQEFAQIWEVSYAQEPNTYDTRQQNAISLFRTAAILRTFAYARPDEFIDYLKQIADHYALIVN